MRVSFGLFVVWLLLLSLGYIAFGLGGVVLFAVIGGILTFPKF